MKTCPDFRRLARQAQWLAAFAASVSLPLAGAQAYIGPGVGAGAIAVVLGVIGSVILAIVALVWYPIKRLLRKRKEAAADTKAGPAEGE